jgi:hypothetical protein
VAVALTPPFAVAAIVMCVAAIAKARAPGTAVSALDALGLPAGALLVRVLAAAELALGVWCLLAPGPLNGAIMAAAYAGFCLLALLLARRHASCGCFGDHETPASAAQATISAALSLLAFLAAVSAVSAGGAPHGVGWLVDQPAARALVLALGIVAGAYGLVIAYTQLPRAWSAWAG